MSCPSCGGENTADARFCNSCGAKLEAGCPRCGKTNPSGSSFCNGCGNSLEAQATVTVPDPRSYTPRHLVEKILTTRSAIEGERKQVTVLFADVKGSTELASEIDPEEWHGIMDRFFRILADGVHRFEGTVNEYRGDGIMALFGAPIAHEDHAQRACYAALYLRDELRSYADELRITRGLNFSVRTGLNSGEVVVGKIGDDLRMDYTALGHTANLAARMEQIAEPGSIYLAEPTAKLIEGFFVLRDLGRHEVKGITRPVGVFELEGIGTASTRLQAAERRGFSRFVGREGEMRTLESALDAALEGRAGVIGVVGEPGVGKSRLCREFVGRTRARGISVYEGHCPAHGKTIPYIPVLQLFRAYFGIAEHETAPEARRKIAGGLLLLDVSFHEVLPLVFEFLAVPDAKNPAPQMDPQAKQRQIYAFLRTLVQARSAAEPAVIFVDDLHWIDDASDAFIAELVGAIEGTRTLYLGNFRPEYSASWMRKSSYQQIALKPLGPRETAALVTDLVGNDPSTSGLGERILQRTGGNPFFVEETIHELVETARLEGTKGAYRLVGSAAALDLPATVQSVLAARIDRLPEREKGTLQTAAVIGKNFPGRVLREVAGRSDDDLSAALNTLRDRELVFEERLFPEAAYAFKHPLTHEVAYQTQLANRRRTVHGSVARAYEKLYPEKLDERAALLAHHWEIAGERLEAARWNRRAAEWAGANAPGETLRHWRKVRELLDGVPESAEAAELGLLSRIRILGHGWRMGVSEDEIAALFDEGRALAERACDRRALATLLVSYGVAQVATGAARDYPRYAVEALQIAEEIGDVGFSLACLVHCVYSHFVAGRLREACAFGDRALSKPPADPRLGTEFVGFSPFIWLVDSRGFVAVFAGDLAGATRHLERGFALAAEHRDVDVLCRGHLDHSYLASMKGERDLALVHAQSGMEMADQLGADYWRIMARLFLGLAQALNERCEEAAMNFDRALAMARERRTGLEWEAFMLAELAMARLGAGDTETARLAAEEAVSIASARGTRFFEAIAHLAVARVLIGVPNPSATNRIELSLDTALALIAETGGTSYEPFIRAARAELAGVRGDEAARQRELREAQRLFLEIGAPLRAQQIERELAT